MRTMGKMIWATAGVGAFGVIVGVGLMMAGDWLGRRDEAALKTAASVLPSSISANVAPSQIVNVAERTDWAPSGDVKTIGDQKMMVEAFTNLNNGTLFYKPTQEVVAQAANAITVVSDQERLVDRRQIWEATKGGNPFLLVFSQSKLVPHISGAQSGLRVASMADSPWAQKAGLQAGDVLTAVNGKSVLDPRQMGEIAKELISAPEVAITVQRAGQEVSLRYHMGPSAQALRNSGNP